MMYTCTLCGKKFQSNETLLHSYCIPCLTETFINYSNQLASRTNELPHLTLYKIRCQASWLSGILKRKEDKYNAG